MRPPRSSPSAPSCSAPATHSVPPSPFKHGTLKDACYRILAVAGPCGAKVRTREPTTPDDHRALPAPLASRGSPVQRVQKADSFAPAITVALNERCDGGRCKTW
jgi:hypothetical protein